MVSHHHQQQLQQRETERSQHTCSYGRTDPPASNQPAQQSVSNGTKDPKENTVIICAARFEKHTFGSFLFNFIYFTGNISTNHSGWLVRFHSDCHCCRRPGLFALIFALQFVQFCFLFRFESLRVGMMGVVECFLFASGRDNRRWR